MPERDRAQLAAISTDRARLDSRDGYRVGPDDLLLIAIPDLLPAHARPAAAQQGATLPTVSEAPAGEEGVRVSSRGDVMLPYLGRVMVEGLTPAEVEDRLVQLLRERDILRRPQVSVRVVEFRSGVVAVVGCVERPGLYPITRPGATVADLVWAAGGPSREAGRVIWLGPEGSTDPLRVDLDMLLQPSAADSAALNPRVRRGDVITVAPAGQVMVDGWVEKPGAYPATRGLTLAGVMAVAGGAQFPADQSRVRVRRTLGGAEPQAFDVDLRQAKFGEAGDVPLIDGDVVDVPGSTPRVMLWGMWKVVAEMIHIGGSVALF